MINDYISVLSAQVIDLEFEISVQVESTENQGEVITNIVNTIEDYMSPQNTTMGQNVNVSNIRRLIQDTSGVITVADLKIFNKTGGLYSSSETSQEYSNINTKQISLIDETIYAEPNQIYQIRFPEKDVKVSVKNIRTVSIV